MLLRAKFFSSFCSATDSDDVWRFLRYKIYEILLEIKSGSDKEGLTNKIDVGRIDRIIENGEYPSAIRRLNLEAPCIGALSLSYSCSRLYRRRNRISHRSRRASQLTDESLTSRAVGAARRCKSPIASPDIQDPIGSDRDVDDARDRRSTTTILSLISLFLPHSSSSSSPTRPSSTSIFISPSRHQPLVYAPQAHRIIPFLRVPGIAGSPSLSSSNSLSLSSVASWKTLDSRTRFLRRRCATAEISARQGTWTSLVTLRAQHSTSRLWHYETQRTRFSSSLRSPLHIKKIG